jgi:hypothetical protein
MPAPRLFLYDVTSSSLEGVCNELGAFGYNRDGKRGKKQVVAGLLTAEDGWRVLDLTAGKGLEELKELCTSRVWVRGQLAATTVPQPRARRVVPAANTRRKLPSQRRTRRPLTAAVDTNESSMAEP